MNVNQTEFDILTLAANGSDIKEISKQLSIPQEDVRDYITEIYARILTTRCRRTQSASLKN